MSKDLFFKRYTDLGEKPREVQLPKVLRVNTCKINPEALQRRLKTKGMHIEKLPFLKHGYKIKKSKFSPGASLEYLLGYYYLQEAASQIPAEILLSPSQSQRENVETVLDTCAAPGGKATHLAALTNQPIIALEPQAKRLLSLNNNIERLGCPNIATFKLDAAEVSNLKTKFSHILVDAPCSGNFVTDDRWFKRRKVSDFVNKGEIQKYLLDKALEVLKPGGSLVYSTCSLEPEENEFVIDHILRTNEVKLEKINTIGDPGLTEAFDKKLDKSLKITKRLWPWKTNTQGFFIAKVRKK